MRSKLLALPLILALAAVAGCTAEQERRGATGALIGGATGAAGGAVATGAGGGAVATGAVGGAVAGGAIGGAAGGAIGASTAPRWCRSTDRYGNPIRYRC